MTEYGLLKSGTTSLMSMNSNYQDGGNELMGTIVNYLFLEGLTWQGHDFLEDAQNETAWNAAKKIAGNLSFTAFRIALASKSAAEAAILLKSMMGY